jgi:broad specificity phosphatase PhoE
VGAATLLSSPYTRTMQTAGIVSCRLGLPVEVEHDLHERLPDDTFGWQTHAEVRAFLRDFDDHGGEWPAGQQRPWEPLSAVRHRAAAALRSTVAAMAGGALVAVCHEMVIRSLTGERETGTGQFRQIDSAQLP